MRNLYKDFFEPCVYLDIKRTLTLILKYQEECDFVLQKTLIESFILESLLYT